MSATQNEVEITAGVDTHKDTHTFAALDSTGRPLGARTFPTTISGYRAALAWLRTLGRISRVAVEGTGSYGLSLVRFLREAGLDVVEVCRPNRQLRRRRGKSDPADAEAAARAALAGEELGTPKAQDGRVEVIRLLRLQRRSAIKARSQAANQLHAVVSTSPDSIRAGLRGLTLKGLVSRAGRYRTTLPATLEGATKAVLRGLARRWKQLDQEVHALDRELGDLVREAAPDLLSLVGVGTEVAGALLVAAGDNPERLKHDGSFASLCGVSPCDASSGRQLRHRLNRGGNRDANRALWVIAFVRIRCDPRTREYVERRTQQGLSKREIIRCIKRYIAREVFKCLRARPLPLASSLIEGPP